MRKSSLHLGCAGLALGLAAACAPASDETVAGAGSGDPAAGVAPASASRAAVAPPAEVTLSGLTVLLSDATVDLSIPAAIDVDAAGNVWVADRRLHQMLVVSPGGEVLRTIGRNGEGPGEFRGPRGLGIRGDRAYVLDNVHGVQSFDMEGNYVAEYQPGRVLFDFDFTGDGGLVASNNRVWARGGLVSVVGPDGEERALVGELPFADLTEFNFNAFSEQIRLGSIPDALRNGALPVAAPDGSLWVVIHTESTIRRYAPDGNLLAETGFDLAEMEAIRRQYFADFAAAPVGDVFFFPSLVGAAVAVNDSLLLVWETVRGTPGLITVHDGRGALRQRLLLPELDMGGGGTTILGLALDPARRRLYVSVSDIATIFGVDLPDRVVPF